MKDMCWYCNKVLIEPIATYQRKHRKAKYRTYVSVHLDCYMSLKKTKRNFLTRGHGSITN